MTHDAKGWHRVLGIVSLVFLAVVSVTGILIHFASFMPSSRWIRVVYLIHSGAFLGPAGRWLYDGAAISFLMLGGTGLVLWVRNRRIEEKLQVKETDLFGDEGVFTWIWEASMESSNQVGRVLKQFEASGKAPLFQALLIQGDIEVREGKVWLSAHVEEVTLAHLRRHRLVERILTDWWGQESAEEVLHPLAHQLEPFLDDTVEREVCRELGHPKRCPHGSRIPPAGCCQSQEPPAVQPLRTAAQDRVLTYVFAKGQALFQRLSECGITPGTSIRWSDGPGTMCVIHSPEGRRVLEMDVGMTDGILVKVS